MEIPDVNNTNILQYPTFQFDYVNFKIMSPTSTRNQMISISMFFIEDTFSSPRIRKAPCSIYLISAAHFNLKLDTYPQAHKLKQYVIQKLVNTLSTAATSSAIWRRGHGNQCISLWRKKGCCVPVRRLGESLARVWIGVT